MPRSERPVDPPPASLTCGHVGCCDSSPNKHATKHFHSTHHPIVRSFERGEDWGWCYADGLMFEPAPRAG
jgi:hypothetical protein